MKAIIATLALLLTAPALSRAADGDNSLHAQFYFFTAPIVSNTQYVTVYRPPEPLTTTTKVGGNNTGFGGELLFGKAAGVNVELGYAGDWSFSGSGSALGVGSVDVTYHFLSNKGRRKIEPFLTGGYSLYYGERTTTQSGFNLGGGVNLWLIKHVAPRLEIRYQGGIDGFHGYSQFNECVAFRVGMTFR